MILNNLQTVLLLSMRSSLIFFFIRISRKNYGFESFTNVFYVSKTWNLMHVNDTSCNKLSLKLNSARMFVFYFTNVRQWSYRQRGRCIRIKKKKKKYYLYTMCILRTDFIHNGTFLSRKTRSALFARACARKND